MDWVDMIVSILSGLAIAIPLIVELVKWVQKAIQEKNWQALLELIITLMTEAEAKFDTGAARKEYVMLAIKASADVINYAVDMDRVSQLIDDLCDMSKLVNAPKNEIEV